MTYGDEEFRLHVHKEQVCGEHAFTHVQFLCETVPKGTRRVVVSMRDVDALDSQGVAALIRLHAEMQRRGCGLELIEVRGAVASQLGEIGLDDLFLVAAAR